MYNRPKMFVGKASTVLLLLNIASVAGQVDLNPQEIQFVADHLTNKKCDELMNALNQKGFMLRKVSRVTVPPIKTGNPCIVRITNWVKGPGHNMTYDYLALRLKEIGLAEVSDKLAQAVLRETTDELHRFFLDNPFKDMIPTSSYMMDKEEFTTKLLPPAEDEDKYDKMFIAVVVIATLAVTLFLPLAVCIVCPRACHLMCVRACPSFCALCFEFMVDGCHRVWYGSKRAADKYLFVVKEHGSGGLMV